EREDIERYLEKKNITYLIDSSNLEEDYTRNKIRHKLLSYAKDEINYGAVSNITNSAAMLTQIHGFLNRTIKNVFWNVVEKDKKDSQSYSLCIKNLTKEDVVIQKGIIRKVLM